jgi:thioredoxin 1
VIEEWSSRQIEQLPQYESLAIFFYAPICGTCKVAERMLVVVKELIPALHFRKVDLNFTPSVAENWEIQSVPCLILFRKGISQKRIYAFQSVEYLYNELKE